MKMSPFFFGAHKPYLSVSLMCYNRTIKDIIVPVYPFLRVAPLVEAGPSDKTKREGPKR